MDNILVKPLTDMNDRLLKENESLKQQLELALKSKGKVTTKLAKGSVRRGVIA